jgi:glycosyltransferase involved in cell wall biosynthesis
VVPLLERAFDVSHVHGDMTPWLFHRTLGSRPLVHTITQASAHPVREFLARCAAVVTQTPATRDRVLAMGVPPERVHLRLPAVDLARFRPGPPRRPGAGPARLLFASMPRTREELDGRGVPLLLALAREHPDVRVTLLHRPWVTGHTSLAATRQLADEGGAPNVRLATGLVGAMPSAYRGHDFTVIPFTRADGGKECPDSALESLACGIPVLVSRACPLAALVEREGGGLVFEPRVPALREAVERGLRSWADLSAAARAMAEARLDEPAMLRFHSRLYREVACAG